MSDSKLTLSLPALSIRQPWAWAIVHAGKDIENRSWPTKYRGEFYIHASKGMTRDEYDDANRFIQGVLGPRDDAWLSKWLGVTAAPDRLEFGGIVGIARLTDCLSDHKSPWFFGPYGFVIEEARPIPFVPCKGKLGFFTPDIPSQSATAKTS